MTERMKPPARRTGGRTLGGAKKTTPPPPPPAAELTPEQFAAEQATTQGEGQPAASAPRVPPAPSSAPVEDSSQGPTETATEVAQTAAQPIVGLAPSGSEQEPSNQPRRPAIGAPETRTEAAGEPVERRMSGAVSAAGLAAAADHPAQPAEPVALPGPSPVASAVSATAPSAEVAVRTTVPPMAAGTAFPMRTDGPGSHQEQDARAYEAPSEGTPYAYGPGRPKDIPEAAAVLNQRIIARESLDSSVPAVLKLKKRIKRFALDNELDHLPIGDIVTVALDEWLNTRGF
ncbi:hypothetical protein [Streptomyces sp. NBC_01236]|uniref:hypothetical protein n=1 Tax=Streptomyces sp. NBC_01236 TaxID=2903789 RepID=UPI002E0E1576|nr:hypothetical protein OG324_44165 [Streptomyces sp. NBC_01236]